MMEKNKTRHFVLFVLLISFFVVSCRKEEADMHKDPKLTDEKLEIFSTRVDFSWKIDYPGKFSSQVEISLNEDMSDAVCYGSVDETTGKKFSATADNLKEATKYYYRFVVRNPQGHYEFEEKSFVTKADVPKVRTIEVTEVTRTTAKVICEVTDDSGEEVTKRGVCWGTSHNPITSGNHSNEGTGIGSYSIPITGLAVGKTYYVRAYAVNNKGTAYGEELSFVTGDAVKPTVTTAKVVNIDWRTATGGGEVIDDGDATVTQRGICWGSSNNPDISSSHAHSGTGTGDYSVTMTGLTAGTTYYVRAYAKNQAGVGYGNEVRFSTKAPELPTVTTTNTTDVSYTTAKSGGNVTSDGGLEVTERGVCWGTEHNPTMSGSHVSSGTGTGSFTANMTGLTDGTKYYVRAYAKNSKGTSYGEEMSFTTVAYQKPTVTTSSVTDITYTTAKCGGIVTSDGGLEVTERGVCWSTEHNPTMSGSHVSCGTGTGSFTVEMTGLTAGTTYYVRAYAKNSVGTSYGEEMTFSAKEYEKPSVTTSPAGNFNFAQGIVTGGGDVTSGGGLAVTERGIYFGTGSNPVATGTKLAATTAGEGIFTCTMTGLVFGTTYYICAYATNVMGTGYGAALSFVYDVPEGAIDGLFSVSASKQVFFSQGNLQYQASTGNWLFAEHQWNVIGEANENISSSYSGWIDLFGWGTSGWNSGANSYLPWSTSTSNGNYYPGGSYTNSLTGSYANADWGVYNKISNGGNQAGLWRTLTKDEWVYVFNTRSTSSGIRYALACVNNVNGVILLPDDWSASYYSLSGTNDMEAGYTSNTITASQWISLEQHGAVFLPATGCRIGTSVQGVGHYGHYWSASYFDGNDAYYVWFSDSIVDPQEYYYRYFGQSVRLVRSAQ